LGSTLPVKRFDAAEGGRLEADALERYAHVVPIIDERNRAVNVVQAAGGARGRVRAGLALLVGVLPINLDYQVASAVVREVRIEGPTEPVAALGVNTLLALTVNLYRRIAVVVGLEAIGQLRQRRMAYEEFKIVIRSSFVLGPREVTPPLPLRYRTRRDGVGR